MKIYLQVLGTGTKDLGPSLLVFFDDQRYLFECGEGVQRFCTEEKIRLIKLRSVFLSRTDWDCFGGIPGLILTLADAGGSELSVYGPRNLARLMHATRHFVFRPNMSVRVSELNVDQKDSGLHFQDANLCIQAVALVPGCVSSKSTDQKPIKRASVLSSSGPSKLLRIDDYAKTQNSDYQTDRSPELPNCSEQAIDRSGICLSYICATPSVPGHFDAAKALALGIPKGPLYGRLSRGEDIVVPSTGSVVRPSDCIAPAKPGSIFFVVNCPSLQYVDALCSEESFARFFIGGPDCARVRCIVHMISLPVLSDERFRRWTKKFEDSVQVGSYSLSCLPG